MAVLGLRWPVLLTGLYPPLAGAAVWQRRQRHLRHARGADAVASLLDATGLQQRLLAGDSLPEGESREQWRRIADGLEAIRALAVPCTELDPGCSVSLLVLLEHLLDRAAALEGDLRSLSRAPTDGSQRLHRLRLETLQAHLRECLEALRRAYDAALEDALRCPALPVTVVLPPLLLTP